MMMVRSGDVPRDNASNAAPAPRRLDAIYERTMYRVFQPLLGLFRNVKRGIYERT